MNPPVAIIGAGLAGSEAALVLGRQGVPVALYEARPRWVSPAHTTALPAELVCSNSFKADRLPSAHGLLKAELRLLGSPLLRAAESTSIRAGSALAVDRLRFSLAVEHAIAHTPCITRLTEECRRPPDGYRCCLITAGPLVSDPLAGWLQRTFSTGALHFYDAIAPIVSAESVDTAIAFFASRWEEGEGDYLNCPFSEEEYRTFYTALRGADRLAARDFEDGRFFESCLPVEVAAERGFKALAFGPLRPVGLSDPRTGKRPFAVCQLRRERASGESYNLVGFQTRLRIPEQRRVFRLIPGLHHAEFLRYGSIHRNTYLESPVLLNNELSFTIRPKLFLAGQLCGNEGYTESIATGHIAARALLARLSGKRWIPPPAETALGSLLRHVTASEEQPFTPSNIHFGLFPPPDPVPGKPKIGKKERHRLMCERATDSMKTWMENL